MPGEKENSEQGSELISEQPGPLVDNDILDSVINYFVAFNLSRGQKLMLKRGDRLGSVPPIKELFIIEGCRIKNALFRLENERLKTLTRPDRMLTFFKRQFRRGGL